jgi:starch synthase
VITVSPQYAKEIHSTEYGCGLEDTVRNHTHKISGLLNGIDVQFWNPASDHFIPFHYSTDNLSLVDLKSLAKAKKKNKEALCLRLKLPFEPTTPLIAAVTRLVPQKGLALLKAALQWLSTRKAQCILLGSSPLPEIQKEYEQLQKEALLYSSSRILLEHNEELAHQLYAASDFFLIPSLFEPCGVTQMIAMRYGSTPIARLTGGLIDTVFDQQSGDGSTQKANGFTFEQATTQDVTTALIRALHCFRHSPDQHQRLMLQGLQSDFSWKSSAQDYLRIYKTLAHNSASLFSP